MKNKIYILLFIFVILSVSVCGPTDVIYKSGTWKKDVPSTGKVQYYVNSTGTIVLSNKQVIGVYASQLLSPGVIRMYGSYIFYTGKGQIKGNYNCIINLSLPTSTIDSAQSDVTISNGTQTYKRVSDNGIPGTMVGSFDAAMIPASLSMHFDNITY